MHYRALRHSCRSSPDERHAYPFNVTVTHTVRVADGALHLTLAATNEGNDAAPVGIALHPYFAVDALGGRRDAVRVHLPGRTERVLEPPIPTGETHPASPEDFAGAPVGEGRHARPYRDHTGRDCHTHRTCRHGAYFAHAR